MDAAEYAAMVGSIARLHVAENKPISKVIAKTVMRITPLAVLANSMREPTEEQLLEVVEQHNPFAVEDLSEDLRARYTAIAKLHLDVDTAITQYREERMMPASFRVLDGDRYLTWAEADPECETADDDKMAEFTDREAADNAAFNYAGVMEAVGSEREVAVAVFNRYHERIR